MAQSTPGTYVLFKDTGLHEPPLAAIVFVDEYAPEEVRNDRPSGYVTLVLLLTEPLRLCVTPSHSASMHS
jgi:hypothetical protein